MFTDHMLAATLEQLDVHFVVAPTNGQANTPISPEILLSGLATSEEARMRLALIPLFLRHPHYAAYVKEALKRLTPAQQTVLCCYYTAAQLLQQQHHDQLTTLFGSCDPLPALFEDALRLYNLPNPESIDERLHRLAARQSELSGRSLNWYGTYEHAYTRLVRHEKQRQRWQRSLSHKLKNS